MEKVRKGPRCALYEPRLLPEDAASLRDALNAQEVSTSSIWRWLEKKGADVGIDTVKRHRRGECYCRRES
jgi:hypothetical protein